jgi:hypothetical protein
MSLQEIKSREVSYLGNNFFNTCSCVAHKYRDITKDHKEFHHTVHELRKVTCITDWLTSSFIFDIEKALYNTQLQLTSLHSHLELKQKFIFMKFVEIFVWLGKSKCSRL